MKRYSSLALIALFAAVASVALVAQSPRGWMVRADASKNATDPDGAGAIKFVTMGTGFHATTPQAAVFWNPANVASGNYSLKGSFRLIRPSGHTNYYGLVFGGSALEGPAQKYLYFLVAQDGTWLIKERQGDVTTRDVAPKTPNAVVKKPDASGSSTNALEVRVLADKIDYLVNGTIVHTTPKTGLTTDGIWGVRVNHLLEVHIDGLTLSKL
jgi:hypothetical protein